MTRIAIAFLLYTSTMVFAQFEPPPPKTPDAATLSRIAEQTKALEAEVNGALGKFPVHAADLEIYVKAVKYIQMHQEWFTADSGKQTLAVIDQGIKRAREAKSATTPTPPWLDADGKSVARGYRSRVDGSVQPYGVVYPHGYSKSSGKKWRLDVHLHGRDSSLTEVKHLNQHSGREAPKDQDFILINIYGRGNNAYRWAGEEDVWEVIADFIQNEARRGRTSVDPQRMVLKGFSMGGAGTWHLGLRHPSAFAALQPGAGFTNTHGYIAKLPDPLADYQERCLTIYDAYRYAPNVANVPVVAYSGEIDKQRQAAVNIEKAIETGSYPKPMVHLIGPGLEHKFPPEWQKKAEAELQKHVGDGKGRAAFPEKVRLTTFTLKNARCDWVEVLGLVRHYDPTLVDAQWTKAGVVATTQNVTKLRLTPPKSANGPINLTIDGQKLVIARFDQPFTLVKNRGNWVLDNVVRFDGKRPGVQGPIDDAFCGPFLCVIGTANTNHPEIDSAVKAQFDRFQREWKKHMRGELPFKKDIDVTASDRQSKNLILFGDPASNSLVAEVLPKLPLNWTSQSLQFAGKTYDAKTHLPMMIQPSPFAPDRYVVLNSGHTFHDEDFRGTNALLYARLGDYAIVRPTPTEKNRAAFDVVTAGIFGENWQPVK